MVAQRDSLALRGPIDLTRFRHELDLGNDPIRDLVPRGIEENLAFREKLLDWGSADMENAYVLWRMCNRSLLFYISAFVWTYDSREITTYPCLPFIPYPFQEETLLALDEAIGKHDVLIDKSRGMGASWMCITVLEWRWHFRDFQSFLFVSRKEELVDKSGDPKALMWKVDFIHEHLPGWLMPTVHRKNLHFFNYDTGSTIDGEATTGDVGRGDYRTAIFMDEFAAVMPLSDGYRALDATIAATRCRIFNSTTKGPGCAYYDQKKKGTPRISLRWDLHPVYAEGITYGVDGKPTSPWYEEQCERAAHPVTIAREIDMDDDAADENFFAPKIINDHMRHTTAPVIEGELLNVAPNSPQPVKFVEREGGRLKLWVNLNRAFQPTAAEYIDNEAVGFPVASLAPPYGDYVIGADISHGVGSSNSALAIGDKKTGEKVGEFVSNQISPEDFADLNVALARWFKPDAPEEGVPEEGAFLIWENNGGQGKAFTRRIEDSGYRYVHFNRKEEKLTRDTSNCLGWITSPKTKYALLTEYRIALRDDLYLNRSERALNECRMYRILVGDRVVHAKSQSTGIEASGSGEGHGDIVIGDALAWQAMKQVPHEEEVPEPDIPWGCREWWQQRRRQHEREQDPYGEADSTDLWCDRTMIKV